MGYLFELNAIYQTIGLHGLISNMQKLFAGGASSAPQSASKTFVKKSRIDDISNIMWYVIYKPHLHAKRLGDFGTFCLVLVRVSHGVNLKAEGASLD